MNPHRCLTAAAVLLALAVALGAFGAHALKTHLSAEALAVYQTAVLYHFWHALGLLVIGILWLQRTDWARLAWVAWLLIVGVLAFSGSLYILAITGVHWVGAITPFGGAAFIAAWLCLAYVVWRER